MSNVIENEDNENYYLEFPWVAFYCTTKEVMKKNFNQQYYKTRNPVSKSENVIKSHVSEIIRSIQPYISKTLKYISVLDVGSGQGEYCFEIERNVGSVTGVELSNLHTKLL